MVSIGVRQAINVDRLETFGFKLSEQVGSGCSTCDGRFDRVRKLPRVWMVHNPNLYHSFS